MLNLTVAIAHVLAKGPLEVASIHVEGNNPISTLGAGVGPNSNLYGHLMEEGSLQCSVTLLAAFQTTWVKWPYCWLASPIPLGGLL